MMDSEQIGTLRLVLEALGEGGQGREALDEATRSLQAELGEPELTESVSPAAGAPAGVGAKGGEAIAVGALLLAVLPSTLPALIEFLKGWTLRNRTVRLKLQLGETAIEAEYDPTAMTPGELDALVGRLKAQIQETSTK